MFYDVYHQYHSYQTHLIATHLKIANKLVEVLVGWFTLHLSGESVDEIVLRLQVGRRLDAFSNFEVSFPVEIRSLHEAHRLRFTDNKNKALIKS